MAAELTSRTEGQTLVLTLNHPGQLNTLSPDMYAAGIEALNGAENSEEVRSVVVKPLAAYLPPIPAVRGITQLGDGGLAPVIDLSHGLPFSRSV